MIDLDHSYTAYSVRPEGLKLKYDPALISAVKALSSILYNSIARRMFKIVKVKKEKSNG